eukprot:5382693-Pyramimonas_sp.AAC.1
MADVAKVFSSTQPCAWAHFWWVPKRPTRHPDFFRLSQLGVPTVVYYRVGCSAVFMKQCGAVVPQGPPHAHMLPLGRQIPSYGQPDV